MQEIQGFIQSLESYDSMHQQKWYFLKEACVSNDYMIHPRIIAQNWLFSLCLDKKKHDNLLI
ncbi:MAG: hypothetical protein EBY16_07560 [Gammaproteobacteria bacterium]|nr:hypothetical protein [Gammaproteobacteria bacterium]